MDQPQIYSKYSTPQREEATHVIENYFRLVKLRRDGTDTVLDVGCGNGDVTMEVLLPALPQKMGKLVGCDISDNMVDYANKKHKKPNVSFVKMDIGCSAIPISMEAEFHHVFSFNCLHWVQNQTQAFQNIYNMLKPDGDMLIMFVASNPMFTAYQKMQKHKKWESYMKDAKDFISPYEGAENPEQDFENLLKKTGFSVHFCQLIDRLCVFHSMDIVRKTWRAVNPFLKRIPTDEQDDFLDDSVSSIRNMLTIEQTNNNNEEKISFHYKSLVAFATKHKT